MKKITVIACLLALLTLSACGAQTLPADEGDVPPPEDEAPAPRPAAATPEADDAPEYEFYTVLPEQEVAMTDAELAASAREEAERQRRTLEAQRQRERDAADYEKLVGTLVPTTQRFQTLWAGDPAFKSSATRPAHLPTTWLIDKAGKLVETYSGRIPPEAWDRIAELL